MTQEESAAASPGSSIGPKKKGSYLRDLTTLQTAAAPPWELHGLQARVGRRIKHYARCGSVSPCALLYIMVAMAYASHTVNTFPAFTNRLTPVLRLQT